MIHKKNYNSYTIFGGTNMFGLAWGLERHDRMTKCKTEAKRLLVEYADTLETSKPTIVSDLKEFGPEVAGIIINDVVVWDNGSIDLSFGKMVDIS